MVKKVLVVFALVLACGSAQAATVYLKNGSAISGKLLSRTADKVQVDVSGITLTYYNDEIERVEGDVAQDPVGPTASATVPTATSAGQAVAQSESQVAATPTPAAPEAGTVPPVRVAPVIDPYAGMTKKALILKFLEVFGTKRTLAINFGQITKSLPASQAEVFQRTIKVEEIIDQLLPLYDKYFTEDDLKTLIDFYSTPVGRKLVEALPLIMNESVKVSAQYFESHLKDLASGLEKAGVGVKPKKP